MTHTKRIKIIRILTPILFISLLLVCDSFIEAKIMIFCISYPIFAISFVIIMKMIVDGVVDIIFDAKIKTLDKN